MAWSHQTLGRGKGRTSPGPPRGPGLRTCPPQAADCAPERGRISLVLSHQARGAQLQPRELVRRGHTSRDGAEGQRSGQLEVQQKSGPQHDSRQGWGALPGRSTHLTPDNGLVPCPERNRGLGPRTVRCK